MPDDDDNIIRFPTFVRVEGEQLPAAFEPIRCYVLVNRVAAKVPLNDWASASAGRHSTFKLTGLDPWRVAETFVGSVHISTVFLGIDHRHFGDGPPLLFETMIFGGSLEGFQNRCSTWDEAEAMHAEALDQVRRGHLRVVK
ncbi:hypothetical protein [Bradyrhizobium stylosanthis]|uniref:hypothetical protein n=1 Tax=Bradyrhizobium stylosanthis TaxID=1803665 RepID=UPI0007C45EA9|nr:hypothetical protein [Bradyrhizobium stylosanthis]